MNCKPGDLAVMVDAPSWSDALGTFVEVLHQIQEGPNNEPYQSREGRRHNKSVRWMVRSARAVKVVVGTERKPATEFIAPDSALRPIRDPGDDAQDETLLWLPVPSRERETA